MKKLFIQIVFFILLTTTLHSQNGFVIKAGIDYSTLRNSDADFKLGYTFGIGKDWNIIKNVTIGSEINYTTRGRLFNDKPKENIKQKLGMKTIKELYSSYRYK